METKAHHFVIGTAVVVFVLGIFGFALWLSGLNWGGGKRLRAYFTESVIDLDQGSSVRMNGIQVGMVESVKLDHQDPGRAEVIFEVTGDAPVRTDSKATLKNRSLMGPAFVSLSPGSNDAAFIEGGNDEIVTLESKPSAITSIVDKAPETVDKVMAALDRISSLAGGADGASIGQIVENVRVLTQQLADDAPKIDQIVDNLAKASASAANAAASAETAARSIETTAQRIDELVDQQVQPLLADASKAAANLNEASNNVEQMVAAADEPVRQFSTDGLLEIRRLVGEARMAVADLNRFVERLREDPTQLLSGRGDAGTFRPSQSR